MTTDCCMGEPKNRHGLLYGPAGNSALRFPLSSTRLYNRYIFAIYVTLTWRKIHVKRYFKGHIEVSLNFKFGAIRSYISVVNQI